MNDTEKPEKRPHCEYPVSIDPKNPKEPGRKACGSETGIFRVKYEAATPWQSSPEDRPICRDHLPYEYRAEPVSDAAPWDYKKE